MIIQIGGSRKMVTQNTIKVVQDWLETNVPHFTKKNQWSVNIPDINLIKILWAYMDGKIHARRAKTLECLKKIIKDEWAKIPQNSILELVFQFLKNSLIYYRGTERFWIELLKSIAFIDCFYIIKFYCHCLNLQFAKKKI